MIPGVPVPRAHPGMTTTMMDLPQKLGKYEVLERIGKGGMAEVYLGYDPFADRRVALKVHKTTDQDDHSIRFQRRLFFNEAQTAGSLKHPNIMEVYDAGVEEGLPYIVMEHIADARTLNDHCAPGHLLAVKDVVEIIFKCARALDYAHRQGVVHRDIKPSNVMLTADGDVKLGDFGIARRATSETTQMLGMIGSPRYMSPEQVQEEDVTHLSDLFSLGVVMYELLTGRQAFNAANFSRLIYTIINDNPPPLRQVRPDLPEELEPIVERLLKKRPERRYQRGNDLAADLTRAFGYLEVAESTIDDDEKFNTARGLAFFRELSDAELWEVLRAAVWERYTTADRIVIEGNVDQAFYIIVHGDVMVKKGAKLLGMLETGDCFGEMAYLASTERTASIYAVNDVAALKLNESLIEQTTMECQLKFLKVFLRTLVARLTHTSEQLSKDTP